MTPFITLSAIRPHWRRVVVAFFFLASECGLIVSSFVFNSADAHGSERK